MSVCFCARWLVPVLMAVPLMFVIGWFTSEPLQAQDVDAVQKRLLKAVAKQELSLEQAAMMMRVLEDSSNQGRQQQGRQQQGRQDQGRQQQGRQDQGRQQQGRQDQGRQDQGRQDQGRPMQQNRQGGPQRGPDRRSSQNDRMEQVERGFQQRMRGIDEAVRSGQLSEEEADRHRMETERWFESQHRQEREHDHDEHGDRDERMEREFDEKMHAIEESVRSGEMSEEEAGRARMEMERWFEDQHRREHGDDEREDDEREDDDEDDDEDDERIR